MKCDLIAVYFGVVFCKVATSKLREKRQDDQWSWGYVEAKPTDRSAVENAPTTTEEVNPCNLSPPSMPDFAKPGRRISSQKCYEYIWNIKNIEERNRLSDECVAYTIKHKPPGVQFAIGGRDARVGEFPHMAAIGWQAATETDGKWIFKCGGSLISSKFVLTAAHCRKVSDRDTTVADVNPKMVRLGEQNIKNPFFNFIPYDVDITRVIAHPDFKSPKKYNDIALLELQAAVDFTHLVYPACLWTDADVSSLGKEGIVTGWGVTGSSKGKTSSILQTIVIDFLESKTCDDLLQSRYNRNWNGMQEHQLCAGKLAGGVDSCQGDSGGPLQVKIPLPATTQGVIYNVVGITSFGFDCALPDTPGVYTRVSSFADWIESVVWPS